MARRRVRTQAGKAGLPPESFVYVGETPDTNPSKYRAFEYSEEKVQELKTADLAALAKSPKKGKFYWIEVQGIHDTELVANVCQAFQISGLVQEDILNTEHLPKISEEAEGSVLAILKTFEATEILPELKERHVVAYMKYPFVITFAEPGKSPFDVIRDRLEKNRGRLQKSRSDFTFYSLLDAVVDSYYPVMEQVGHLIEDIDAQSTESVNSNTPRLINSINRELIYFRKAVRPLKESIRSLIRSGNPYLDADTIPFFKDLGEHVDDVMGSIESFRDHLKLLHDRYLASMAHKTNEIIKTLTVFATIFTPLTFLTGVYGMNFHHMPELDWRYSYALFWLISLLIPVVMMILFKKRGWWREDDIE